ncbi:MAG: phosphopantothenoylcysteine decarboxylase [Opitutaceae bacterium]|nr:phosphopantothenoylcysteine decarboxylase [Opitutaceae bacterium]
MKLLVTAGATREPLDAVRFLANISTGATGAALADALTVRGHEVSLLRGTGSVQPRTLRDTEVFSSAEDLAARLRRRLGTGAIGAVIMNAAVADYRPAVCRPDKITSDAAELTVRLVRNEKILMQLKAFSPRPLLVVGFKLTVGADAAARQAAVAAQLAAGGVDAVVLNDLDEINKAAVHPFWLYRHAGGPPAKVAGVDALAEALDQWLREAR